VVGVRTARKTASITAKAQTVGDLAAKVMFTGSKTCRCLTAAKETPRLWLRVTHSGKTRQHVQSLTGCGELLRLTANLSLPVTHSNSTC
jgi:hypothetical protein